MSDFLLPGEEPKEDIPAPADVAASDNTQLQSSFLLPGEQGLSSSLQRAVAVDPDQAGKVNRLSQATGIPPDVVTRNQDAVENQAKVASIQSAVQGSPVLAQQMANPSFAAVAHDDVPTLQTAERVVKGLDTGQSFRALPDQAPSWRDRLDDWFAAHFGGPDAAQIKQQKDAAEAVAILAARQSDPSLVPAADATPDQIKKLNDAAWEQSRQAIGGMSPMPLIAAERFAKAATFGLVSPVQQTEAHSTDESVAGGVGKLAGFITGPVRAAQALMGASPLASLTETTAGESFMSSLFKNVLSQSATLGTASGLEQAGSSAFDSHSIAEAARTEKQAVESGAITGGIFGVAGRALPDNTIAQWLGRTIINSGAQDAIDGTRPWDSRDPGQKVFDYGLNAFFSAHGAGRTGGNWFTANPDVVALYKDAQRADKATEGAGALAALSEISQASKLRERDPAAFKAFIRSSAEDGQVKDVYVDAQTFANTLEQAGIKPEEVRAQMPEVAAQLADAVTTKSDIRIPVEDYATHLAGGPADKELLPHLKTEAGGMSYQEAKDFYAQHAEGLQADVEKILSQKNFNAAMEESGMSVENELMTQLNDANRFTPDVNKVYAKLAAATFKTRAAQLGITPEEMYVRYPLEVQSTLDKVTGQETNEMDQAPEGPKSLDEVKQSWDAKDIDHAISENDKQITVGKIMVPEGERAKGIGTEAMKELSAYADRTGKQIVLSPSKDFGASSVGRLKDFYKSLGFVENKGRDKDFSTMESMIRNPVQNAKAGYNQGERNENGESGNPVRASGEPEKLYRTVGGGSAKQGWLESTRIRRDDGEPATVYRGAARPLGAEDFGHEALGVASGHPSSGLGVFFSVSKGEASDYGDVGGYHLDLRNPFTIKAENLPGFDTVADAAMWREKVRKAGHDGIIISAKHLGGKVHVVAFEPEQVIHPKNEFDQGERGKISFGDDITKQPSVIHLLENADLSTFVHELGHFNLEVLNDLAKQPDSPPEVRADMDTLLKWFGVKDLNEWNKMSLDEKRPFHEQLARGFESYLFEGKAPSTELQGVFSRIRAWMVNAYKSLASLNVTLTPEVRGVFDRMLATNEQIVDAEAQRGYEPMFKSAEEAGATPEEWKAYQEQQQEQTQEAVNQLQSRSLRDMQWLSNAKSRVLRSLQRDAKAKRALMEAEVTNEVNAQPTYQAQHFLRTGEMRAENGDLVKVEKGAKLDTDAVQAMYPMSMLNRPDLLKLKGMTRDGGLNPDLVADMFGHTSGDQLVRELVNLQPKKDVIEGMTDQRMLERYGDLTSPDAMDRAANEALANEAHLKMLATELRFAEKAAGQRGTLVKAAKEFAAQIIARKKVGDISPRQFEVAENKARKAAQEAHLKGDRIAAAQAKREQLVNAHAAKMAYAALDEIRKGSDYQKKFDKDSIRNKIDVDIRDQIDALRERFDFRKTPPTGPTRAEQNLQEWMEGQIAAGYAPMTNADMLNQAIRMHYEDMSLEQFRGFVDTLKSLEHIGRERRTLTIDGEKQDLNEYVKMKLVPKMQERGERFTKDQLLDKPEDRHTNPIAIALDHFNSWRRSVATQLKPQEFKRNEYDRHELLGPFGEALFDPVINANYRKVTMLKELSKDFQAEAEKLGREWQDSLRNAVTNDKLIDPDKSEEGAPVHMNMTRGKMLGMAIHVGNESNFNKLARGWGWEPGDVWKFLHTNMSEKDWQAVQAVWDLYEKHWPDMEAMNRRLGNTSPDKIEPRPFRTQFGEMRGGYAAISYDSIRSRRGEKAAANDAIAGPEGLRFNSNYFRPDATTNGSLNKRVDSYIDRVDLDFHGIARHLNETIHDLAYREALIDANKVIEHPEFRREFKKAYGPEAYKSMRDWLGQLANSNNTDQSVGALGKFLQYTRTGMVINAIAFRASTVLKHGGSAGVKTLGYFAGGGEKYLASRMASMGTDYKNQIEGAVEKFGEIRNRLTQQDRDFRTTSASMFEPESKRAKAERFGHAAVAWSDMMTAVPTAWAAYDRAVTEGIPESQGGNGQPMTEKQAVNYANKIVREAHGTTAEAARSMVLNTQSEAMKMFTTLYGFMNNTYGQQLDAYDKLRTSGISSAPVLARSFMALLVPALWAGYLSQHKKDGDSWAGWVGKAISGEVASSVPFVRDAYSMAEGHNSAGLVAAESWLSSIVQAGKDVARASQGDSGKTKPIKDVANAVGTGLHVPGLGQLGGSLQYAADVHAGKENPASTREYLEGLAMGHAPKH